MCERGRQARMEGRGVGGRKGASDTRRKWKRSGRAVGERGEERWRHLGKCVTTMVWMRPMRSASLAANSALTPATMLHTKSMPPRRSADVRYCL